jgi:hypothetical protein
VGSDDYSGLLIALKMLAETPGYIESLFENPEINPKGVYGVKFANQKTPVYVDDYIPCKGD